MCERVFVVCCVVVMEWRSTQGVGSYKVPSSAWRRDRKCPLSVCAKSRIASARCNWPLRFGWKSWIGTKMTLLVNHYSHFWNECSI